MARRASALPTAAVAAVLVAVVVGAAAVGGWLVWQRVDRVAVAQARAQLAPLAAEQLPLVVGYDFQTVERSLGEAAALLTPEFRGQFQERAASTVIPQAREGQIVIQADVVGAGVLAAERDSGSVMVFMNRTVTDRSRQPVYDGSRLRVEYRRIDGRWLIDDIILL